MQLKNIGQQLVQTKHFDFTRVLYSVTALGHLTLGISPPHKCSNYLITPNPTGTSSKSDGMMWQGGSSNKHNKTNCVILTCVVRCVCVGISVFGRQDWQPQLDADCGQKSVKWSPKRHKIKEKSTATVLASCWTTGVSLKMNGKLCFCNKDLTITFPVTNSQLSPLWNHLH